MEAVNRLTQPMSDFRFYHSIEVRYSDLDPQGHLNNAIYLSYFEQARAVYIQHLGLWDGTSFEDIGIILADARVSFLTPVRFGQELRVGLRVVRMGAKSIHMVYRLEDSATLKEMANGTTVLVTYDYKARESILIPEVWRHAISTFEEIPPKAHASET